MVDGKLILKINGITTDFCRLQLKWSKRSPPLAPFCTDLTFFRACRCSVPACTRSRIPLVCFLLEPCRRIWLVRFLLAPRVRRILLNSYSSRLSRSSSSSSSWSWSFSSLCIFYGRRSCRLTHRRCLDSVMLRGRGLIFLS